MAAPPLFFSFFFFSSGRRWGFGGAAASVSCTRRGRGGSDGVRRGGAGFGSRNEIARALASPPLFWRRRRALRDTDEADEIDDPVPFVRSTRWSPPVPVRSGGRRWRGLRLPQPFFFGQGAQAVPMPCAIFDRSRDRRPRSWPTSGGPSSPASSTSTYVCLAACSPVFPSIASGSRDDHDHPGIRRTAVSAAPQSPLDGAACADVLAFAGAEGRSSPFPPAVTAAARLPPARGQQGEFAGRGPGDLAPWFFLAVPIGRRGR